jgi:hypothetical protein
MRRREAMCGRYVLHGPKSSWDDPVDLCWASVAGLVIAAGLGVMLLREARK